MTRDELVQALEVELGRPLTDDEVAFVERTLVIRRGVIGTEDVILLARDIRSKTPSASASISSDPAVSLASDEPDATTDEPVTDEIEGVDAGFPPIPLFEAPGPSPIGVPLDFVASRQVPDALGATRPGDPTRTQTFEPRYFEGDELGPATLDPSFIARLQRRLVAAGLLKDDDYYSGYWDDLTAAAYKKALGYSNVNGTDVSESIDRLIATLPESKKDLDKFAEPPFLKADIATLAQKVKTTLRNELGRDPTSGELAELTGAMRGFRREGFDAFVAAERAAFEGGTTAPLPLAHTIDQGSVNILSDFNVDQPPSTLQDVDPEARFQELFEQRFKPEIDRLDSLGEVRRNTNNVFASLRTMSSLIGGR